MREQKDPKGWESIYGGGFYVSVIDGGRSVLALGPFETHGEAKRNVERVTRYVSDHYERGWFYSFGTCKVKAQRLEPGKLNGVLS